MALAGDADRALVYSNAQVLLLFGDSEDKLVKARAAALRAGCRIAAATPVADGSARFDEQLGCDAAIISVTRPSADFDALLARVATAARAGRMNGVVIAPFAMIDAIVAAELPREIEHLCDPDDAQLEQALIVASERAPSRLYDIGRNEGALLLQLSEDAARIASMLAALSETEGPHEADRDAGGDGGGDEATIDAAFVRNIIRARRLRDQFFRGELFADPAFDTLLDLYAARLEGVPVAVSSLCIAAAVPATTALRWIRALTDKGLFVRVADPEDGRRIYIGLSEETARAMGRYLGAVQRTGLPAV